MTSIRRARFQVLVEGINNVFGFAKANPLFALLMAVVVVSTGCMPKNAPVTTATSSEKTGPTYQGFSGATAANTTGPQKVQVLWTLASDPSVTGYNVYDVTLRTTPKLIKTLAAGTSQVSITNLTNQSYYVFRVRAQNKQGVEDGNTTDVVAIPYGGVVSSQSLNSASAQLTYSDASNADSVAIFCQVGGSTDWTPMGTVSDVTKTVYTLGNLQAGTPYVCRVAVVVNGFTDNNTVTTTFTPVGVAASLAFTTQPGSGASGSSLGPQPIVTIKDANGTVVAAGPDSTAIISLTVSTNSPTTGTIRGAASVAAVKGVATFSGINLQESGLKILTATKSDTSTQAQGSPPISVDSNQFTITAGGVSAANSLIAISPAVPPNAALIANGSNSYSVTITLRDQFNNPVVGTKPTFGSNIGGDTLTQPAQATNATGVTTGSISTTIADTTPARTLSITSPSGLTGVTVLAPFVPGPASKLVFTTQPVNSPAGPFGLATVKVAVADAQGNVVGTGATSTATIGISIAANTTGAVLTGTSSLTASSGLATYSDLGISKNGNGYKLQASSGALSPAFSNSFNIASGVPSKIIINGVAGFASGSCSGAFTIQLQDAGGNPSNAIQNTPVTVSGLVGAQMYTSSACGGSALSMNQTFTAGTNTKTVYLKDVKAEAVTMMAADPSNVLTAGTFATKISPDKISLIAQAPAPAAAGTPMTVVAGKCSAPIEIIPAGDNTLAGPIFTMTTVTVTGVTGSSATLYTDAMCTSPVIPTAVQLLPTVGTNYSTYIYIKDPKAESLNLSVNDPNLQLSTISNLQPVSFTASNLILTGPTSVVSGQCSAAFTVKLQDTLGNNVQTPTLLNLAINGIGASNTGHFYTSAAACTNGTGATNSAFSIPANASQIQIFLKDSAAENFSISISDPSGNMTTSATIQVGISPSDLRITGPVAGQAKTSVCAGPFTLDTLDGAGNVTNVIVPITALLSGQGTGGTYYLDSGCVTPVTQFTFAPTEHTKTFYHQGLYPAAALTLTATDQAGILNAGTLAWIVKAAPGFIGTAGSMNDSLGNLFWFQQGVTPVAARMDGPSSAYSLHFDSTKQFLYVTDYNSARILKYDYTNKKYVGWIGQVSSYGGVLPSGSTLAIPADYQCQGTLGGVVVPGWCLGGQSQANNSTTNGSFNRPSGVTDDGTYVYVANRTTFAINRYDAQTGSFTGWIGLVAGKPNTGVCSNTNAGNPAPGWCLGSGGNNGSTYYYYDSCNNSWGCNVSPYQTGPWTGNGRPIEPKALANDGTYMYVASRGAVMRFLLVDGSFQGWIGYVANNSGITSAAGASGCETIGTARTTPGWCLGGQYTQAAPNTASANGSVNDPTGILIQGSSLLVVHTDNSGTISKYDLNTGAFQTLLATAHNWSGPYQAVADNNFVYVADSNRMIKIDSNGSVAGWVGKVQSPLSMGGNPGCNSLSTNSDTPGWCTGGTSRNGMDEQSFHQMTAIELDSSGNLITGQGWTYPAIKSFKSSDGTYNGTLAMVSNGPSKWSNDKTSVAGYYGFDDVSMNNPAGMWNDGSSLYLAEFEAGRVKKIDLKTGNVVGWIGAITSVPSGPSTACQQANPMGPSPGWCLGSNYQPRYMGQTFVTYATDGVFVSPSGVVGDSANNIFVVDSGAHRVLKFNATTGAFIGWVGAIASSPTGQPSGATYSCVGATTVTPGWCTGGSAQAGGNTLLTSSALSTTNGGLWYPSSISYDSLTGQIFVADNYNHRVVAYDAATGAFKGWIGRINPSPSLPTVCQNNVSNGSYLVSIGWCKGGNPAWDDGGTGGRTIASTGDRGGAFNLHRNGIWSRGALAVDGGNLYIANTYNYRIDKWNIAGGYFLAAAPTRVNTFTNAWIPIANPATPSSSDAARGTLSAATNNWGCDHPLSLHVDSTSIFGSTDNMCNGNNTVIWKMGKGNGTMVGWQGGTSFSQSQAPTGGDPGCSGLTGAPTPGWCQGGSVNPGFTLGYFTNNNHGMTGDASFVYISDENTNRVTRIPK